MHVFNRIPALRFGGEYFKSPHNGSGIANPSTKALKEDFDYSEIALPENQAAHRVLMESLPFEMATDCFDGSALQGQIRLPEDHAAHRQLMDWIALSSQQKRKQAEATQQYALPRMLEMLDDKMAQHKVALTQERQEMALLALRHSLLTQKNDMLLYGSERNENWLTELRKMKHLPQQAKGLDLETLLDTDASTWGTLGFDWKVHNLHTSTLDELVDQKPAGLKFRPMTSAERLEYHHNETIQEQLEQQMEKLRHEKLDPLQHELRQTQAEAQALQDLLVEQNNLQKPHSHGEANSNTVTRY